VTKRRERHNRPPGRAVAPTGLPAPTGFERLIVELSARFMDSGAGNIDREIDHTLEAIGTFAQVDRSYVFQFSADGTRVSNTHEWCANGVAPAMHKVQDAPVELYAWAMARFRRGECLHLPDLADLPPEAERERLELESQDVRSVINVPLACAGKVLGFVGFDSVRGPKTWREDHIHLLMVVGQIIAAAIERERATAALERQVRLETLVASISSRFINVSAPALGDAIGEAIERIGTFTGVDRSYLFQLSGDGRTMDNTHEWCAPGIEPHIDRLKGCPVELFGYSMARMSRGEVFQVLRVADLPPEATMEREEFEREGIKTLINVPIMVAGRMIGFLGFDAVRTNLRWSDDDIRLLRLTAEIFANAMARKTAEERLQISLHEKESLLREIHHRVKNNLQVVHSLLYLQATTLEERLDDVAAEAFRQSRSRIKSMAAIHDRLYRSKDLSAIECGDYLRVLIPDLFTLYDAGDRIGARIEVHIRPLAIHAAIPCALIVNELVANCLKHAFPDRRRGRIEIEGAELPDGLARVTVSDDGVGFCPEREAARDPTLTLGMHLVRDLVAQLDGHLDIASEPGMGSRFRVTFPLS
jgi:two-component sensor histidine kinase